MYTGTMCVIEMQKGNWEAETRGMGPNGARRVVWAPGVFFFLLLGFFCFLNYVYRYYMCYRDAEGQLGG